MKLSDGWETEKAKRLAEFNDAVMNGDILRAQQLLGDYQLVSLGLHISKLIEAHDEQKEEGVAPDTAKHE